MNSEIPLFGIHWEDDDIDAVQSVIRSGRNWSSGPEIGNFEARIAEYIGTKHAVTFNSGTSALHALLLAYGFGPGDEVIVPSFTFISTANAPMFVGSRPVFADIESRTYGLDPTDVKEKITGRTRAIMPVHYGGCCCLHIEELKQIAEDHGLLLIEDAAEAFGSKCRDRMAGTFGDAAMFSLCQNKIITTGEGGVIVTDSEVVYDSLQKIVSHGRDRNSNYFSSTGSADYGTLGYNFRMPTMAAALGLSQLRKVRRIIRLRRENAEYYTSRLDSIEGLKPPVPPTDFHHVYQLYTIQVENGMRDSMKEYLETRGIQTKVYFDPVHLTRFFREKVGLPGGSLPVTEELYGKVLTLPMWPNLGKERADRVVEEVEASMKVVRK